MRFHRMLFLVSFVVAIALAGCINPVSNTGQDSKLDITKLDNKKAAETCTQPQYFFMNGSLLGSYDKDGWHSLCDTGGFEKKRGDAVTYYAKDLLDQDSYYVYENNKLAGVSKQIIWSTEEAFGLGTFEDADAPKNLAKYGELYRFKGESGDTGYRIFDLPIKLGDELCKLKIPDYSFNTEFPFGQKWARDCLNDRLVTNIGSNLFPKTMSYGVEPTAEGVQLLTDLFKKNNIENTVPNFTECVLGDFDNDGKKEYLMFAEPPRSEMGYPLLYSNGKTDSLGVFNFIFYQDDDGSIKTLHSDLLTLKGDFKPNKDNNMELMYADYSIWIDLCLAADLNADGVYEIGVKKCMWDCGYYLIYALNSGGEYEMVMRSNFGT